MQENEFEKQVKQRMDEFHIHPSVPVWLQVENELRKKRRRKRLIVLLPLLAILLTGGYFTTQLISGNDKNFISAKEASNTDKLSEANRPSLQTEHKETTASENKNIIENNKKEITTDKTETSFPNRAGKRDLVIDKKQRAEENIASSNTKSTILSGSENTIKNKSHNKVVYRENNNDTKQQNVQNAVENNDKPSHLVNNSVEQTNIKPYIKEENSDVVLTGNQKKPIDNSPVLIANSIQKGITTDSIASNSLADLQLPSFKSQNIETFRSHGLKVGFTFAAGASTRSDKSLNIGGESSEKSLSSSLASPQGIANGGVLISPPSEVKPGVAFKAGVIAMKPLSNRFDISAGLLYSYTSDVIKVGETSMPYAAANSFFADVRALSYNANANVKKKDYTNKYHFIELPVSVYFNLSDKWKTPIVWNAGISVSRLISTNALLYNAALGGVYYEGKKDINKTQLSLSTGFSFRFGTRSRWQWNIGPEVYLNTTKLFNNAYDENKHPLYGGLHLQALMPVKKKRK